MNARTHRAGAPAFSLAELMVVVGIISLLVALLLPTLGIAHQQAKRTQCSVQLQQIGRGLSHAHGEHSFYPLADDAGAPTRYTWMDVLIQRRYLGHMEGVSRTPTIDGAVPADDALAPKESFRLGYCPGDALPDALNVERYPELIYPLTGTRGGIDYSYGIGVPLSSGGWAWRPMQPGDAQRPRSFRDYDRGSGGRVLAGDAYASGIYNLSGRATETSVWNQPTQYDNTVAWGRHGSSGRIYGANLLFQDGHVSTVRYNAAAASPVNTSLTYVWRSGESLYVNPSDRIGDTYYPNQSPPSYVSNPSGTVFPNELLPSWYTQTNHWTLIGHK